MSASATAEGADIEKGVAAAAAPDSLDPTGTSRHEAESGTEAQYSVFNKAEKWFIVVLVAFAAWFSTVSSFVYFPALTLLADTFAVSIDDINLTVTSYMAVATVAPPLVGDAADVLGRRPLFLTTLAVYLTANICLATARSFAELVGLRVLQALGVAGIGSISYGVITDIASPAERGSFVSAISFAVTIAPSLGPVLGGALSYAAGWAWIFWFLAIVSGLCLVMMTFFLPETARSIVGDGSIRPAAHLSLPIPALMRRHWSEDPKTVGKPRPKHGGRMPNPLKSLKILLRKDNAVVILAQGLMYVVYTCVTASLSTLFIEVYHLNQWQAGIIYLPFGLGGTVSTFFSGALLDRAYRDARIKRGLSTDKAKDHDLDVFPIEKARLSVMWIPMGASCLSVIAFGWVLHYEQHIAIPLAIQFIVGLTLQLDFSIFNTLLVDINHRAPSAATASTSLVRCTMAAIAMAFLEDLITATGIGWTFTFMGGLCLLCIGLFALDYHRGMYWRQKALGIPPTE